MSINKKQILDSWKKLQKEVNQFVKDKNVDELQKSVVKLVTSAQKDLTNLVDKDVAKVKAKIKKEANQLEKKIEKVINDEFTGWSLGVLETFDDVSEFIGFIVTGST